MVSPSRKGVPDVDDLEDACDTLATRFRKDKIYTWFGPVLVVVNPFKTVSAPSSELRDAYFWAGAPLAPYAVAHCALHGFLRTARQD
jgi:hypothetical protein